MIRKKSGIGIYFLPLVVILLFLHDFLFLNLESSIGSTFALNLWKEIVAIGYLIILCLRVLCSGFIRAVELRLILFLACLFCYLLFGRIVDEAAFRSLRALFTPFVLAVMLSMFITADFDNRFKVFKIALQCVSLWVSVFGIYQLFSYSQWSDFWYVEPLTSMGFELKEFNAMRDGKPRISSFFTSSLEFAFFIVFVFFINYAQLLISSGKLTLRVFCIKILFLGFLIFLLFNSTVRSAQICWVAGIGYSITLLMIRRKLYRFISGVSLVAALCCATFLYIGLGYTDDLSAIGRLVQWNFVFNQVLASPIGLGLSVIGPGQLFWFDSFWLNLAASFGFASILIFAFFIWCYKLLAYRYSEFDSFKLPELKSLVYALLILCPIFIYAAFFQAFYNSTVFYLFLILLFTALIECKNVRD